MDKLRTQLHNTQLQLQQPQQPAVVAEVAAVNEAVVPDVIQASCAQMTGSAVVTSLPAAEDVVDFTQGAVANEESPDNSSEPIKEVETSATTNHTESNTVTVEVQKQASENNNSDPTIHSSKTLM